MQINIEYFFYQIYKLFTTDPSSFVDFLNEKWMVFKSFSTFFSALFITGIIWIFIERNKAQKIDDMKYTYKSEKVGMGGDIKNERWQKVVSHLESFNMTDWRMAILEADIILDEMTTKMGYRGDNLGEKLKSVEKSDFTTIDKAWEAHKIRNMIAHEGSDYILTNREARRIIGLYEEVFKEFYYI